MRQAPPRYDLAATPRLRCDEFGRGVGRSLHEGGGARMRQGAAYKRHALSACGAGVPSAAVRRTPVHRHAARRLQVVWSCRELYSCSKLMFARAAFGWLVVICR